MFGLNESLVAQAGCSEVDQERTFVSGRFEVVKNLCAVYVSESFDRFEFDDDRLVTDEVSPVWIAQGPAFIRYGNRMFACERYAQAGKLDLQRIVIDSFKKAIPKFTMNFHRRANDGVGFRIFL
jgi:hypothetical protein